jgi:V/A-type H+-transporting ATPase subunit I
MISILPGYREVDISAAFLFFLSIFFAMLVGDAGYGALFLILTAWARIKKPNAPASVFSLLYILSTCTLIWGILTGNYFGYYTYNNLPSPLKALTISWLAGADSETHLMLVCFYIGAIHLTLAHLWNTVRMINTTQALAQIGWICTTWTMFFAARTMVLNEPFPGWVQYMLITGVVLIICFMTPVRQLKSEWFNHVMLPLTLISNFVDVVSYLRLFAVGTASFAVANAFNEMLLANGLSVSVAGLGKAVLLFAGHALNIVLAAMGVLVHGVRLNTLEFSSHVGMQWTGTPYQPFEERPADATAAEKS